MGRPALDSSIQKSKIVMDAHVVFVINHLETRGLGRMKRFSMWKYTKVPPTVVPRGTATARSDDYYMYTGEKQRIYTDILIFILIVLSDNGHNKAVGLTEHFVVLVLHGRLEWA